MGRFSQLGLPLATPVSTYDKTKWYYAADFQSKVLNGQTVWGAPLTSVADVFTLSGGTMTPAFVYVTANGRAFCFNTISATPTIGLLQFNFTTGAWTWVGRIQMTLANAAATTHVTHVAAIYDGASSAVTTGWKIVLGTTGSVVVNGGFFVANNVALSDFTSSPTVFWSAIATGAKATYFYQDPTAKGVNHVQTVLNGGDIDPATQYLYGQNGVVATPNFVAYDLTQSPAITDSSSTIQSSTTLYAGTAPSAFFLYGASLPPFAANDQVVLTGTAPTGFTASTASAAQTVYFIRDIQLVSGNYYFNLSATSGGAAITPTSAVVSGMTIMRAFGISTNSFLSAKKTGTVTGLSGTILNLNNHRVYTPTDGPNSGSVVYSLPTSTGGLWEFKVSDFTAAATTLPSASNVNTNGTGIDYTAIVPLLCDVMPEISQRIIMNSAAQFLTKYWANSAITTAFGGQSEEWIETKSLPTLQFGLTAVNSMCARSGWLFISGITAGQRVIIAVDLKAEAMFGLSYMTTPVTPTPGWILKFVQTYEQLFDLTDSFTIQYKTAATSTDAVFNNPATGWTTLPNQVDESGAALQAFTQFRILNDIATFFASTPAQLYDVLVGYLLPGDSSDNWVLDNDLTTQGTGSPSYAWFYLKTAYASGTVPPLTARVKDTSGTQIFSATTAANPTSFAYSTDGGTTTNALGTIPNTVGTLLRVLVNPTPSGLALPSLSES